MLTMMISLLTKSVLTCRLLVLGSQAVRVVRPCVWRAEENDEWRDAEYKKRIIFMRGVWRCPIKEVYLHDLF